MIDIIQWIDGDLKVNNATHLLVKRTSNAYRYPGFLLFLNVNFTGEIFI